MTEGLTLPNDRGYLITVEKSGYIPYSVYQTLPMNREGGVVINCFLMPAPKTTKIYIHIINALDNSDIEDASISIEGCEVNIVNEKTGTDGRVGTLEVPTRGNCKLIIEKQGFQTKRVPMKFEYAPNGVAFEELIHPNPLNTIIDVLVKTKGDLTYVDDALVSIRSEKGSIDNVTFKTERVTGTDGKTGYLEVPADRDCELIITKNGYSTVAVSKIFQYSPTLQMISKTIIHDATLGMTELEIKVEDSNGDAIRGANVIISNLPYARGWLGGDCTDRRI